MAEMAAMVDVGAPLVSECYFNEMKLFGALTIHESVDHLRNYFALQGNTTSRTPPGYNILS